jgi:argininosuccinate lyase
VDGELLQAEIRVNQAHAKMLARVGLVSSRECRRLVSALGRIAKKFQVKDPHKNPIAPSMKNIEDVHTFVQHELEKKVGGLAKKIHTGRSRNDLVVTSTLVYLKEKLPALDRKIAGLEKTLVDFSQKAEDTVIPGLTHMKRAQPILLAHHLLAYVEMLERDRSRLRDALSRMNRLPLGAGALAGSGLRLDTKFVARELGFTEVSENSLDAVSDRDFVVETLGVLAILWTHLSRLAEDFILWNSEAFDFVTLDDSVATGSSLMPQKKNPDVFELVRGRAGVIFGHLLSSLTLLKGLPLAYNRDLQEDKPALFDALHKTALALGTLRITIARAELAQGIRNWAEGEDFLYATDLLEYLVEKGVPFREAHEKVGGLVRYAADQERSLSGLSPPASTTRSTSFLIRGLR